MPAVKRAHETGPQTLIQMHHPAFRHGYQAGRKLYFEHKTAPLSDKELLDCLATLAQEGTLTDGDQATDYYTIGQLIGQLSGAVIPRHPDECAEEEQKERVLAQVRAACPDAQEAERIVEAVTTLWNEQDMLACCLDVDTYEQVLCRGMLPPLRLVNW